MIGFNKWYHFWQALLFAVKLDEVLPNPPVNITSMFSSVTQLVWFFSFCSASSRWTEFVYFRDFAVKPLPSSILDCLRWLNNWHIKLFKKAVRAHYHKYSLDVLLRSTVASQSSGCDSVTLRVSVCAHACVDIHCGCPRADWLTVFTNKASSCQST